MISHLNDLVERANFLPERVEPEDGDERRVGTIMECVIVGRARRVGNPVPPPFEHPIWRGVHHLPNGLMVVSEIP